MPSERFRKSLRWLIDNGPRKAEHYWEKAKEKAKEDELFGFGLWATTAYFAGPVLLLIVFAKWPSDLSTWGDFLAGVFGPIAFLWLIVGYLQQGKELRNSARALEKQAAELNAAVRQHKEMVRITEAQLEQGRRVFEHTITPALNVTDVTRFQVREVRGNSTFEYFSLTGTLHNHGSSIYSIGISITGAELTYAVTDSDITHLETGTSEEFSIRGPDGQKAQGVLLMEIIFNVPGNGLGIAFFRLSPDYKANSSIDLEASLVYCTVNVTDTEIMELRRKMETLHL